MTLATAFWIVVAIVHLPTVSIPILFVLLRNRTSSVFLSPTLLALNSTALIITIYSEIARAVWVDYIGIWYDFLVIRILMMFVLQSLVLILVWLYIAYLKTKAQIDSMQTSSDESKSMELSIHIWNFFLGQKFAVIWVTLTTSFCGVISLLALMSLGRNVMNTAISAAENGSILDRFPAWSYAAILPLAFPIMALIVVQILMRNVKGTLRIRQILRLYIVEIALGVILHQITLRVWSAPFNHGVPSLVLITVCDIVLGTVKLPLLSRVSQSKSGLSSLLRKLFQRKGYLSTYTSKAEENFAQFEDFLKTDAGFADFRRHLEKEFAVENLLFWKEAQDFKKRFADTKSQSSVERNRHAWAIYSKYLSPSAPLELNLPSDLLKRYRNDLFRKKQGQEFSESIFDESVQQILRLMQYSSMDRYLRSNPETWHQYLEHGNEKANSISISMKMKLVDWVATSKGEDGAKSPRRVRSLHRSGSVIFKATDLQAADNAGSTTPREQHPTATTSETAGAEDAGRV